MHGRVWDCGTVGLSHYVEGFTFRTGTGQDRPDLLGYGSAPRVRRPSSKERGKRDSVARWHSLFVRHTLSPSSFHDSSSTPPHLPLVPSPCSPVSGFALHLGRHPRLGSQNPSPVSTTVPGRRPPDPTQTPCRPLSEGGADPRVR